jgi:dihydroorotate dehydrogenase electron transfer subunit
VKKAVGNFKVLRNTKLNDTNYFLELYSFYPLPEIEPGQFVNVEIKGSAQVFLRRPFSIASVNHRQHTIGLIVKVAGKGSEVLSKIEVSDTLSLVYPLGKGFSMPGSNDRILLVGGGSGVAPLLFLANTVSLPQENIYIVVGAKTKNELIKSEDFGCPGQIQYTTEDGSFGFKGLVTGHPFIAADIKSFNRVYTCGPAPMMKAVARIAKENSVFCEVSLENLMACGFGVCLCCIEPTVSGNLCVCSDGPVFNIEKLKW